jgi:hypothetical protein
MNAGVFYKCPICADKSKCDTLKELGIFFPERDASWELEQSAFSEFLQPLDLVCESEKCNDKTQNASKQYMWKLCHYCGAHGNHIECFEGGANDPHTCNECSHVLKKLKLQEKFKRQRTWISDEEVLSDEDDDDDIRPEPPKKN